ncbi:MAG TPA: GNAT family N-acetyltransferase, partial [Gaiellaceae bacterium]|nr:GNAT family N-acetyltransferase [Gaiellaceae bacterium]
MIRVAETDEELARFAAVRLACSPRETAAPPRRDDGKLLLLWDDVACALAARSNLADSVTVQVYVRPEARREGIGAALAERLVAHARTLGRDHLFATVDSLAADGVAFAGRRGLVEVDREVELRRTVGDEPDAPAPAGIELVSVAERPELLEAAWHAVGA